MSKQLILPKSDKEGLAYLSYSQISTWKKSKRDYIRQYFFKEGFEGNAYTDFGSKVGEAFENNDFSQFDFEEQLFLEGVPVYDQFEKKIKLEMNGFYVVGYIDTNSSCLTKLADYKTGDIEKKRGDYESDDYNQLEIYAAAIEQETGILPTDVKVFLIGRGGNAFQNEKLVLTKEFITITRDVTPEKVAAVKSLVQKTAEEISAYYTMYLKLNGLM
jgi:hypothetical protein